jgi:hypothetical protein
MDVHFALPHNFNIHVLQALGASFIITDGDLTGFGLELRSIVQLRGGAVAFVPADCKVKSNSTGLSGISTT